MGGLIVSTVVWIVLLLAGRWFVVTHLGDNSTATLKMVALLATVVATIVGVLWP